MIELRLSDMFHVKLIDKASYLSRLQNSLYESNSEKVSKLPRFDSAEIKNLKRICHTP